MAIKFAKTGAGIPLNDEIRAAKNGTFTDEQQEFLGAVQEFRKQRKRNWLFITDYLEVLKALGYRKGKKK